MTPTCPDCHGAGFLYGDNGPAPRKWTCEECGGAGVVEETGPACDYCAGPLNEGVCPECDLPLVTVVRVGPYAVVA